MLSVFVFFESLSLRGVFVGVSDFFVGSLFDMTVVKKFEQPQLAKQSLRNQKVDVCLFLDKWCSTCWFFGWF